MTKKRTWRALVAAAAMLALPAAATAHRSVLYEVTENMYFYDGAGKLVSPDLILSGQTCTVTATGMDNISLATGRGWVRGTYAVVPNIDNPTDAPEFVVQTGTFVGDMDLSLRPLGTVKGTFTPTGTVATVPFSGIFRLPFNMDHAGRKREPKPGKPAFYLADDGKSLIPVLPSELSLGTPLVRLELSF